jgi:hypothetical protein
MRGMRRHRRKSARDLDDLAHENWDDPAVLADVAVELFRRRTAYARSLRADVIQRLTELILEAGFPWPTTDAPGGTGDLEVEGPVTGVLRFLGYHVGTTGLAETERREILDSVYQGELPPVNSAEYMNEWGHPGTAARLQKLAESLAAFARNAKRRRTTDLSTAIDAWEADLEYLKREHYIGRYDFVWPMTR